MKDFHKERSVIDVSDRHAYEASAPVAGASNRERRETGRPLKPTLVKPEVQPRKEFVEFYATEVVT
jgi:hypothetical protein